MADQFYGLTDPGKERSNNEDTFIAQLTADGRFIIGCVIDGVGGYEGGEIASTLAREAILQRLEKPTGEVTPILLDCFNGANQKILAARQQNRQHQSMACVATLTLVDVETNQFHYVHVGDTRLYLLRDNSLVKITQDQSFVGFLEDSGRIPEKEAMNHPKRNEINKALGFDLDLSKDERYLETGQSPFLPGDTLLLCSDGLTDMVPKAAITSIITRQSTIKQQCAELIAAANEAGGKDNITAVLIKHPRQAVAHDATKPVFSQKKTETAKMKQPGLPQPPAVERDQNHRKTAPNAIWPGLVSVIALIFMGISIWQYSNYHKVKPAANLPEKDTVTVKQLNKAQQRLQAMIDTTKSNLLIIDDSVNLNQPLTINRDTLFIKTKHGLLLRADSGYTGPAVTLGAKCKLLLLDSLVLRNFSTGVVTHDNALLLKNTRFINCALPLQHTVNLPNNKFIGGTASAFKADSLPVKTAHK